MRKLLCLAAGLVLAPAVGASEARAALVISRFDDDAEGWGEFNDGRAEYSSTFGNPAGSFRVSDRVRGTVWYFLAPDKFLGDQSSNYGGTLSYDLWVSHYVGNNTAVGDVVIRGNGLRLKWRWATPVAETWTTQTVRLDTTGGWERSADDKPATEAELRSVLSDLDFFAIRGEYRSGEDHGYLDNVILSPVPGPGGLALMASALGSLGLWAAGRRWRSGERG